MSYDLYVWSDRHDLEPEEAMTRVDTWVQAGADPAAGPFEPSTDVAWFFRELTKELPDLEAQSDAVRDTSRTPIWLSTDDPLPARVVAIHLTPDSARDDLDAILGLAAKYDLVLFDPRGRRINRPLETMAEHATATFWPRGAIQAFVAGAVGLGIAVLGWSLGIAVLSWIAILVGGFLVVMAVFTFIHEGRRTLARRSAGPGGTTQT
jgi:pimeloyl-ACP methyl ester carboxylesterase